MAYIDSGRISQDAIPGHPSLGSVYAPDSVSKTQAKAELQGITTRLGNYIQYVREISENANQVDLESFVNSIKILEQELVNIKVLYERELGSARQEGDDLSRTRNHLQLENSKLKSHSTELENRLAMEVDKNRQAVNEINLLQQTVMQRDHDLTQAKLAIQKPISDLDELTNEFHATLREKEDYKRRYEHEQLERQDVAEKNHQMQKKIDIDTEVSEQETRDLNDRLNAASNTILKLESKIREMTHADTALAEMLQRVREVAEQEISTYQKDSEARFSQNVSELQSQINESNRKIGDLNDRNQQLHMEIGNYQSENRSLNGQVTSLEHQRRVLEEELTTDRQRSHEHIKLLEHKLTQLQNNIISKMKELNAARDAQIPLKAEIETLRSLLEEEEKRLRLPSSPRMDIPPSGSTQRLTSGNMQSNFGNSSSNHDPPSNYKLHGNTLGETSPRPLGPVRVRSAPASKQRYFPRTLGQGNDYFDELFQDLRIRDMREQQGLTNIVPLPHKDKSASGLPEERESDDGSLNDHQPSSANTVDYTNYSSSAVGDIKILEVSSDGSYIRLLNSAITQEAELGGFMIQQNVGGHPVAVFRFPPRVRVAAGEAITVWAASSDSANHKPPTDFYFKEQQKWGTGPECTTIVCRPNGQAVAWTTMSQRYTRDAFVENGSSDENLPDYEKETKVEQLTEYDMNVNAPPKEPVYLRREKETPPSLNVQKHPHGVSPPTPVHPHTGQSQPLTYGNDNSSVNRQARSQSTRPDPIPGAPYAGASAQRMGSASLRRYPTAPTTVRGSGSLANKSAGTIRMTSLVQ